MAYSAWTAELTYAGAFYIREYGVSETTVGVLLAVGSVVFLATSLNTARLTQRYRRRRLVVAASVGMGVMLIPVLNVAPPRWSRSASSACWRCSPPCAPRARARWGSSSCRAGPGSMMGARTASAQLGYMLGAAGGGLVLAVADFGTLGFVLFAGMLFAAYLHLPGARGCAGRRLSVSACGRARAVPCGGRWRSRRRRRSP